MRKNMIIDLNNKGPKVRKDSNGNVYIREKMTGIDIKVNNDNKNKW